MRSEQSMRITSFGLVGLLEGASESNALTRPRHEDLVRVGVALIGSGSALVGIASRLVATPPRMQLRVAVLRDGRWRVLVEEVD